MFYTLVHDLLIEWRAKSSTRSATSSHVIFQHRVQFFATTADLQKILMAIETHQPYLITDNLTIRPLNAFRGFKPGPGQEPELNVQLEVGGWTYPEPVKVPQPAPKSAAASVNRGAT